MADTFNPRGAPVPSTNYYDGWELTNRPAMLPFLAEYTNAQGDRSGGMAMPSMVEEPINALSRLLNTPSGTMPDPNDSQNRQDALLGLMSLYGGNALGGMARGAAGRAAGHALEMETARPVAYSNAIEGAMSNPSLLRMMDDIDYAGLNRRALDEYGVGYEGLNSSQEAALRGWSDPALLDLFSDTGKPNPVGAAVASGADNVGFDVWHGSPHDFDKFDMSKIGSGEGAQAYGHGLYFADSEGVAKSYREPNTGGWGGETLTFNGIPQDRLPPHLSSAILTLDRMAGDVGLIDDNLIKVAIGDLEKRLEELKKSKDQSVLKYNVPSVENTISGLKEIEGKSGSIGKEGVGYLYQTRINADPNHFLDWDKPLSQQSDNVRNAVEAAAPGLADEYARMRATGHAAFQNPEIPISQYAVQPGMSEKLRDAGIPGIKYLDQGSRGAGEGTSNYVLFNDALANIVHKWRGDQQLYSDTGKPNPAGAALAGNKPNADVMASYGLRDGPLAPAIAKAISDPGEFYYGIRTTPYKIEPGQTMPNSTEWFQDANPLPWSELLSSEQKVVRDYYPELSLDELNAMKFDPDYVEHGKPLNGSSAIEMFGPNKAPTLDDIERARRYQIYGTNGDFVHLVRSRARPESGYDLGEWIMPGAEVVSVAPFGNNLFSNASPLAGWLASGANALAQSEEQSPGDFIPHGWELTNRPAMLPFLAEYTNRNTGEKSGGFAMPSMVTEPINALASLLNTPSGTMPNPQNQENQQNALTALLSLYGGNALGGMVRGAAGRAAGHALEMEATRPVAYSNAFEGAMSHPDLLRMMDDIDYAGLNRRALDEYGVGYEGLNSSQEAALRGWSDPSVWGDDASTFASKNASIFDPPKKLQRAFEEDYPDVTGRHDAQGRLTVDIDGNPLNPNARYVVGRRVVGGDDEAFSPAELNALTEILTGQGAQVVSAREMGRDAGRTLLNLYTGEPLGIQLRSNLSAVQSPRVFAHEIGHMIDAHAAGLEGIPQTGIFNKELKPIYNSLNNPNRQRLPDGSLGDEAASWAKPVKPETFGYKGENVPPEYMAEAIRAYMADPNYMKTVAWDTAKRIREYVNSNPRLNQTIQFNADIGRPNPLGAALVPGAERQPDHLPGPDTSLWPYIY